MAVVKSKQDMKTKTALDFFVDKREVWRWFFWNEGEIAALFAIPASKK